MLLRSNIHLFLSVLPGFELKQTLVRTAPRIHWRAAGEKCFCRCVQLGSVYPNGDHATLSVCNKQQPQRTILQVNSKCVTDTLRVLTCSGSRSLYTANLHSHKSKHAIQNNRITTEKHTEPYSNQLWLNTTLRKSRVHNIIGSKIGRMKC